MNSRIRKKKEKRSLMEYSFEICPEFPYKKRKHIINKEWKMWKDNGYKILIGYKRKEIQENDN